MFLAISNLSSWTRSSGATCTRFWPVCWSAVPRLRGPYRSSTPSINTEQVMIVEVQHETRLEYTQSVTESVTEVRMEPASDGDQSCRSFHLTVSPPTQLFRYQDGFGNRVHHFNVLAGHAQVRIL